MANEATKQDIITRLIPYYEAVIANVEHASGMLEVMRILNKTSTNFGICHCAYYEFGKHVHHDEWVKRNWVTGKRYWGAYS